MFVEQISIFVENKEGRLAEVTAILRDADVNIKGLSLADTTDYGVLRLIVDNNQNAELALKDQGFKVGKLQVLAVEVLDQPGGLNRILDPLSEAEINIEYMYSLANPKCDHAVMIFRVDDPEKTLEVFTQKNIRVISAEELEKI